MADVKENRMDKLEPTGNGMMNLSQQMDELLSYKRKALETLQHAVLGEQATLVNAKQEILRIQSEAKYAQQVERDKFQDSLKMEKEAIQNERRSLEQLDMELNDRRKEVERMEMKTAPIVEALRKLQDERIAVEQQRLRNEELRAENDRLANSTSALHEEVRQVKASLLEKQTHVNRQAAEQERLQHKLNEQQKDVTLQLENLMAIKQTVDPKLAEIQTLQAQTESDRHQIETIRDSVTKQQSELDKQRTDLSILSSQLQAKADALTEYDAILKRTEAEVRIKVQQAKLSNVDIPMPEPRNLKGFDQVTTPASVPVATTA